MSPPTQSIGRPTEPVQSARMLLLDEPSLFHPLLPQEKTITINEFFSCDESIHSAYARMKQTWIS